MIAFPERQGSLTGSAFISTLLGVTNSAARDQAIFEQFQLGNVPDFLRDTHEIRMTGPHGEEAVIKVLPDYLSIGVNLDFVRMPMTPIVAQKIADLVGGQLPTRKLVNAIWTNAQKLAPQPFPPDAAMVTVQRFFQHHQKIEIQREKLGFALGELLAGHKKDVVVTRTLKPGRVAIYGWQMLSGKPIQGLNSVSHSENYADYSHGIRFIDPTIVVDGEEVPFLQLLRATDGRSSLVTDEGPNAIDRYAVG